MADSSTVLSDLGTRIIKVDHAGEHGAVCIYSGQILAARLTAKHLIPSLLEVRSHEQRHRAIFRDELARRGAHRCRSYYLCAVGGFTLGIVTGLLGSQSIAATTVAVERVVLRHLERQMVQLQDIDPSAATAIRAIHSDEQLHHDMAQSEISNEGAWMRILSPLVSGATEAVIWLGMRL